MDLHERVAAYLRSAPTPSVPLARVYGALVAEVGRGVGSYGHVRSELMRRSDLFVVMESRPPFGDVRNWSPGSRYDYESAMVEAGADAGPRVALVSANQPGPPDPLAQLRAPAGQGQVPVAGRRSLLLHHLDASIVELWRVGRDDPTLRADLAEAVTQTEEIRKVLDVKR